MICSTTSYGVHGLKQACFARLAPFGYHLEPCLCIGIIGIVWAASIFMLIHWKPFAMPVWSN